MVDFAARDIFFFFFAYRNSGFSRSKSRLFQLLEAGASLPPDVTLFTATIGGFFLYARICDLSDRSDAIRPSGLGVKSRLLAVEQLCWKVMNPGF